MCLIWQTKQAKIAALPCGRVRWVAAVHGKRLRPKLSPPAARRAAHGSVWPAVHWAHKLCITVADCTRQQLCLAHLVPTAQSVQPAALCGHEALLQSRLRVWLHQPVNPCDLIAFHHTPSVSTSSCRISFTSLPHAAARQEGARPGLETQLCDRSSQAPGHVGLSLAALRHAPVCCAS